jgi:hypothetical protein
MNKSYLSHLDYEPREESLESALEIARKTAKNPKMCIAFEVILEDKSIN